MTAAELPVVAVTASAAATDTRQRAGTRFAAIYTTASSALWIGLNVPSSVLIAEQIGEIDPAGKERSLAIVLVAGALVSLVANPVAGTLSDATTSRFGRRRPWALAGGLGGAVALVLLGAGTSVAAVTAGWALVQLTLNVLLAVLMAMVPDRIAVSQRGFVSALAGLAQVAGPIVGLGVVVAIGGGFVVRYAALAVILVAAVVLLVVGITDPPVVPANAEPISRRLIRSLWVDPRRHPDFGWAWITRFLVMLGYAIGTTYLLYFLQDAVGYAQPDQGVLVLTSVAGAALLVTIVAGGIWSDRAGRRKVFVSVSSAVIAAGLLTLGISPTWPAAITAAALLGAGFGVYLAVDVALITQVLPSDDDRGKDLGVVNIANTLPTTFAPAVCGVLVKAGGYPVMYATATVITLAAAVLVHRIRSVP
jgi:MFS family permease